VITLCDDETEIRKLLTMIQWMLTATRCAVPWWQLAKMLRRWHRILRPEWESGSGWRGTRRGTALLKFPLRVPPDIPAEELAASDSCASAPTMFLPCPAPCYTLEFLWLGPPLYPNPQFSALALPFPDLSDACPRRLWFDKSGSMV
jgi:hypothetical protein